MSKIIRNIRLFSSKSVKNYMTNPISGKVINNPSKITDKSINNVLDNYDINYKNKLTNPFSGKTFDYNSDIDIILKNYDLK